MEASFKTVLLVIFIGALVLFATAFSSRTPAREALSETLRTAGVETDVVVSGRTYRVSDGLVVNENGESPNDFITLRALRVAYALSLARVNPLLDISGTDPIALRAATRDLSRAATAISEKQLKAREIFLIQTALYPTAFLDRLADTAEARARFLASGSDRDADHYHAALDAALAEGHRSARAFQRARDEMTRAERASFVSAAGTITPELLARASADIVTRMEEARSAFEERGRCLRGRLDACRVDDIVPVLRGQNTLAPESKDALDVMREVVLLRRKALGELVNQSGRKVMTFYSACFALLSPPYYFDAGVGNYRPQFVGDIVFHPTSPESRKTLKYLREEYDIDHAVSNNAVFYTCPEVQNDIGIVRAVLSIAEFARAHPDLLPDQRGRLLSRAEVVRAGDAWQYLHDGLEQDDGYRTLSSEEQGAFMTLALMMNNRTADLDVLVRQIAQVLRTDIEISDEGVPFDIEASKLFLTHSAFPSLFLAHNPSAGETRVNLRRRSPDDLSAFSKSSVLYSEMRETVPQKDILEDIQAFKIFERK